MPSSGLHGGSSACGHTFTHRYTHTFFLKDEIGVVEKIQQSKVFIAFAEDLTLVPNAHIEQLTAS